MVIPAILLDEERVWVYIVHPKIGDYIRLVSAEVVKAKGLKGFSTAANVTGIRLLCYGELLHNEET